MKKSPIAVIAAVTVALSACSSGPNAADVSWGNLPAGTQEWIADAIQGDDCGPIRNAREYVAVFEEDEAQPSEAYVFLQDTFDDMNCDRISADEQMQELLTMDLKVTDVEQFSNREDNPLYFGPGCVGTVRTLGEVREPRPQDDLEGTLARLLLASQALLDSLPTAVTKTGASQASQSEDAAMRAAATLLTLGDGLLGDDSVSETRFQEAISDLERLETELNVACILEYEDGPQPATT